MHKFHMNKNFNLLIGAGYRKVVLLGGLLLLNSCNFYSDPEYRADHVPGSDASALVPVIVYPRLAYSFVLNGDIGMVTPTLTGETVNECSVSPTLPAGLVMDSLTCSLSGIPTVSQSQIFYTVIAKSKKGDGSTSISIEIGTAPVPVYSTTPYTMQLNTVITTIAPSITGDVPTECTTLPDLPNGLSISRTTCAISGTPTSTNQQTSYKVIASNNFGQGKADLVIYALPIDNKNGTVYANDLNLTWSKCPQNTTGTSLFNSANNDCSNGVEGGFRFCSTLDNACDNGVTLNGTGVSDVWTTCASSRLANRTWRVPTIAELSHFKTVTNDSAIFPINPMINNDFWSSTADPANAGYAKFVRISIGVVSAPKSNGMLVRCVSDGP